jgi:2-oxoglutarate ferredoxin oxidoreductase subunit delta
LSTQGKQQAKQKVAFKKFSQTTDVVLKIVELRCKGCDFCVRYCPREMLILDENYFNPKGYHIPKIKDGKNTQDCSDCKFCQLICPEFAIFIEEVTS